MGIEADADKAEKVIKELNGKNIQEVIEAGSKKLASVPSGGGAAVAAAPAGAAAPAADAGKKEDKKAKKEESEEEDDDMGFGLFD